MKSKIYNRVLSPKTRRAAKWAAVWLALLGGGFPAFAANQVAAWGAGATDNPSDGNDFGQSIVPATLTNAVQVAGGWRHSLALRADGTLLGWGDNSFGQTAFPAQSNYVAVACGYLHSLALQTNGIVLAEGYSEYGQADVPSNLTNVVAVACGFYHSLALTAGGFVTAWGAGMVTNPADYSDYGQSVVPPGLSNVVAIAGGAYHSLALKSDGTLVGWGDNASGQARIPAGLSNVVAIAAGGEDSLALKADGTLLAWGGNTYDETNIPAGLSNVVAIAAGGWHNLALTRNGTVVAWGAGVATNAYVGFGQNVVPAGLSNVVQVAAGAINSLVLVGTNAPLLKVPLSITSFRANSLTLALPTRNGRVYQLQDTAALTNRIWSAFPLQFGVGGISQFTDPAPGQPARFYRVSQW